MHRAASWPRRRPTTWRCSSRSSSLGFTNTTASTQTVNIVVGKFAGAANPRLKFVLEGASGITGVEHNTSTGSDVVGPTIFGHNGTGTVGSTAAIPFNDSTQIRRLLVAWAGDAALREHAVDDAARRAAGARQARLRRDRRRAHDVLRPADRRRRALLRNVGGRTAGRRGRRAAPPVRPRAPARRRSSTTLHNTGRAGRHQRDSNGSRRRVHRRRRGARKRQADSRRAARDGCDERQRPSHRELDGGADESRVPRHRIRRDPAARTASRRHRPRSTAAATSEVVTGLTNGATYTFKVAAFNVNGSGPASAAGGTTTIGAPGIPTAVTATPGNGQAVVKWTAPASNGLTITGYTVTPFVGGVAQAPRVFNSAATTETVTGLTNGTTVTFKVAARTVFTTGLASKASPPIVVGAPIAPTAVTATAGVGRATVHWTAPAANNGAAITGYVVTPFVGGVAQAPRTFLSTATTQTITGLTSGTAFVFRVAATNSRGTGPNSAPSNVVTVT